MYSICFLSTFPSVVCVSALHDRSPLCLACVFVERKEFGSCVLLLHFSRWKVACSYFLSIIIIANSTVHCISRNFKIQKEREARGLYIAKIDLASSPAFVDVLDHSFIYHNVYV
jgi:hypothetical protein